MGLYTILAIGVALVVATACDDRPKSLGVPISTPVSEMRSPTPSESVDERRVPVQTGVLSAPVDLEATLLVVVYRNVGSSQPPTHVERVHIGQQGIIEQPTVLDASEILTGGYINSWRNVHHPAGGSGEVVIVALCHGGACGGEGPADDEAKSTLVQTRDNGVTWETLATLDGGYWVVSWRTNPTEVVLYDYPTASDQQPSRFVIWPSMQAVNPAATLSGAALGHQWPVLLAEGRVGWWWNDGRLLDNAGDTILDLASVGQPNARPIEILPSPNGERLAVTWNTGEAPNQQSYWTLFERETDGHYHTLRTVSQPDGLFLAVPHSWLSKDQVIIPAAVAPAALGLDASVQVGYVPAILDFTSGEVRPLAAFTDPEVVGRGNLVVGID